MATKLSATGSMGRKQITEFALFSRLTLTLLQVVLNNVIPDHAADAFHQDPIQNPSILDHVVEFLFGGFRKWDAAYFLHIAESGYTQDQMFAFFPFLPISTRLVADTILYPLQAFMHVRSVLLIAGWGLNTICFILASMTLFELTNKVTQNRNLAFTAAVLFCINPASIFMSAIYTETMYSLFSMTGMLLLEKRKYIPSALLFAFSAATRSNGIISFAFIIYHCAQRIVPIAFMTWRAHSLKNVKLLGRHIVLSIFIIAYSVVIIITPFLIFQFYAYCAICKDMKTLSSVPLIQQLFKFILKFGKNNVFPSDAEVEKVIPEWCNNAIVLPYSAIQLQHWNVGFMKYYKFKQIPNFLLASPMVVLCLCSMWDYCQVQWKHVKYLGLWVSDEHHKKTDDESHSSSNGFYNRGTFVYLVHALALLVFGVLCMHVQVVTRFLASSCPVVYWYSAHIFLSSMDQPNHDDHTQKSNGKIKLSLHPMDIMWNKTLHWKGRLLRGYFLTYFIVGVILHCNFLPWT